MSVVDDRLSFISVPAVQLHTAAAMIQGSERETSSLDGSVSKGEA